MSLYKAGFPPLGHIQTGNIFVEDDEHGREICKLGGYENRLLGYPTLFQYEEYKEFIDVIMFGMTIILYINLQIVELYMWYVQVVLCMRWGVADS